MNAYMGEILRVNRSKRTISKDNLSETDAKKYVGGRKLATKILFDELEPGIDPLGAENKLVYATGIRSGFSIWPDCRISARISPIRAHLEDAYHIECCDLSVISPS